SRTFYIVKEPPRVYYERFFYAIQARPSLWDPSHESYNDDKVNQKLWKEVADMVGKPKGRLVHLEFLRMRKGYEKFLCGRREIWHYTEIMSFLGTNIVTLKNKEKKVKRRKQPPPHLDVETDFPVEVAHDSTRPTDSSAQPTAAAAATA
ncbi:hypothetical protein PFISCL1PPCAC_24573, partial [Pristionchus fissidentatus]